MFSGVVHFSLPFLAHYCITSDNYDTDGDEEGVVNVPQGENKPPEEAYATGFEVTKAVIDIAAVISQLERG